LTVEGVGYCGTGWLMTDDAPLKAFIPRKCGLRTLPKLLADAQSPDADSKIEAFGEIARIDFFDGAGKAGGNNLMKG